ncbi:MAG: 30S ribosomal protein S6 [Nitrospinaceae bacterium]
MRHYQTVIILKSDLDESHIDETFEKIADFIEKCGGTVVKLEKWGKKRLAYRVKKNKFGYYLNCYHSCDPARLAEFEKELQLYDLVIKYLAIRLEEKDLARVMKACAEEAAAAAAAAAEAVESAEAPAAATDSTEAAPSPAEAKLDGEPAAEAKPDEEPPAESEGAGKETPAAS